MKNPIKLTLLLLALLMPITATAYDFEVDDIYYNINGTTATVTYGEPDSNRYSGNVTIPPTVTYNGTTYSVTTIGGGAFYECSGLISVTIPNSVTIISDYAFNFCPALKSVTIPNSVTSIGEWAFYVCPALKSVTIPKSVTSINKYSFYRCTNLDSLIVASGNTTYDSRNNCNAIIETTSNTLIVGCKNTVIPNTVTTVGDFAFIECIGLTSVTIPNSVTTIGFCAFGECCSLIDVYSYVTDLSNVSCGLNIFYADQDDYSGRTLHVLPGMANVYQTDENWYPYFGQIVEMELNGDANLDGFLSIADVSDAIDYVLGFDVTPFYAQNADINCNGRVDLGDIVSLIDMLLQN